MIRNILSGGEQSDRVFDTPAYENALKKSGYTDEEARAYWTPRRDPYSQESLEDYTKSQAPKVVIEGDDIVISAPKDALSSPFTAQLQKELSVLKGANLKSPEVKNAIDKLNEEIQANYSDSLKETLGWSKEEYEDYQRAIQATSTSTPMKSSDYLKWGPNGVPIKDEKGEIIIKTPEEWIEYWRENYNADERTSLFKQSLQSNKPYERTMALIMAGPGGTAPVYGYSQNERTGQFLEGATSEMGEFPEELFRLLNEDNNTRRVESFQKKLNIPVESLRDFSVNSQEQFETKIKDIQGKSWDELSNEDKAFVIEAGVSRGNKMLTDWQQSAFGRGVKTQAKALDNVSSSDNSISKEAIKVILDGASFDKYKEVRNNYDTWQNYEEWTQEDDERLAQNQIWAGVSSQAGRVAGTIGRFLWENAVVQGLTGGISPSSIANPRLVTGAAARKIAGQGFSMNRISDNIGAKIVEWVTDKKIPLLSNVGKNTLTFAANLIGTIPEDIFQTAVDNIVTYKPEENENLINPTQLSENFRNNLIIMSLFNAAKVGYSQIRLARLAKKIEKAAKLAEPLNINGIVPDVDDMARAAEKISIENGQVSIVDDNGNRKVLDNITPEQGRMVQQSLFDQPDLYPSQRQGFDIDSLRSKAASDSWDMPPRDTTPTAAYDSFIKAGIDGDRYRFDANEDNAITRLQSGSSVNEYLINPESYITKYDADDLAAVYNDIAELDAAFNSESKQPLTLYRGSEGIAYPWDSNGRAIINTFVETSYDPQVAFNRTYRANLAPEETILYQIEIPEGQKLLAMPDNVPQGEIVLPRGMEWELTGEKSDLFVDGKKAGEMYTIRPTRAIGLADATPARPVDTSEPQPVSELARERLRQLRETEVGSSEPTARTATTTVEIDSPDGRTRVEAPDFRFRNRAEVLDTTPGPTQAALTQYHNRGMETLMEEFTGTHLPEFQNRFGDVQVSDFDWALWNAKKGLTPEQIVGTTDPTTGRTFTQGMADAINWFGEQPFMKELRMASREAQGMEGDFNLFGYLPHTTYDPTNVSFEEALNGRGSLWEPFTGASMLDENNVYKGFGGDFNSRYRTFASNMLWDAKAKDIAASKVIEEAQMEGVDITPEQAIKVADGAEALQKGVDNATTTKEVVNGLTSDGDTDFAQITKNTAKDAENLGLGQSIHENWAEVYPYQNTSRVTKQRRGLVNSLDTQANFLRNTQTADGSMYENGAADIVYSYGNAMDIVSRYMDPTDASATNLRDMMVEYYTNHGRPQKYAEIYADKAMSRLGEVPGQLTKAKAVSSLANSMKWEAWSKLRRWLVRADYSQFNSSTRKHIDQFLFNHMQMDSIKNNPKISQKLTKALETMTGLRYRAIFYGNIKNALLQTSELNRYFSAFKWGDVATMAKRLATDEGFRARVDTYFDVVAPRSSRLDADLYGRFSDLTDNMEVEQDGVKFKDLGEKAVKTADAIGLAPIEAAESFKNRMMIAGLLQEADRLGLSGDEALRHIRSRFERVALAADEMGRIGMSANPLARTMLFLQNFQIRELGMHLYNILDETGMAKSTPKAIVNATKYLTKVLGAKLATTLILARLGYSASQTLGLDPFGLLDDYNKMDKDDMNWVDQQIAGGLLTPIFSGGMTSLIGDMYFMARKAYEDSVQQTVSGEAEERVNDTWGLAVPEGMLSWENMMEGAKSFVPGSNFANRIGQMNELMDSGWATSATGNKMYTAPDNAFDAILGYLFGRSATQNALQYNQMYGDNLLQTLGRFNPLRGYQEFDPIDTENYSDWFKGGADDLQQFNKGRYWFQNQRDRILDEYQAVIGRSYASSEDISEAQNDMNRKLDELYDKLERFVTAYEKKNGPITSAMVKQILNILNTGRNIAGETAEQRDARQQEDRAKAIERYSQLGLPPIGTYTGPTVRYPETETKYQGSPQYRAAVSGYYDLPGEAVRVLRLADEDLAPIRKEIQDQLSYAYSVEDWDAIEDIQRNYLERFDQVVAPIIAAYGNSILTSTDVANQLNDMLSTGTNRRSGNLIPSSTYAKNKRGRYQSTPYERVDVGKWAQQRYSGNVYEQPTIRSWSTVEEDLAEIKKLAREGRAARARARALELRARVDNQERSMNREDYNWLIEFLKNGGNK